jgi:WD40 repeat protein
VLRPELLSESARRRFRRETRALARLDHPAIARIHAAGVQREQQYELPFVVMELVEGAQPITQWWTTTHQSLEKRLELFAVVCDAVHHGHLRGLVHRDLKPSNVLVSADERPKVIDFGVASMTSDDGTPGTVTRAIAGTPGYMAPEQFMGDASVDLRTDVHGLGLLLHECLTGKPVFARDGLTLPAAARLIESESAAPLGSIQPSFRGDLETIVMCALQKRPADRYPSAADLAADLRRFLAGHPIEARPTPPLQRLRMLARRNPIAAAGFLAATASLILGTAASVSFGLRERSAAQRAELALATTERALWLSRIAEMIRAVESGDAGVVGSMIVETRADQRWPMRLLRALADESLAVFHGTSFFETFSAMAGAVSPDGSVIALAMDQANGVLLLDAKTLHVLRALQPGTAAWDVTFNPVDGRLLVGHDRSLSIWESPWRDPPRSVALPIKVGNGIACSPDGKRVIVCGDGRACLVDLESERVLAQAEAFEGQTTRAAWSPDGNRIAISGSDGSIRLLDPSSLALQSILPAAGLRTLALDFDPSGRWLAVGGDMRTLRVFDLSMPSMPFRDLRLDFSIWGLDWRPDGAVLAVADRGSGVRIVDVPADQGPLTVRGSFSGHRGEVWDVAWAPDQSSLYSIGQYEVHRWQPSPQQGPRCNELGAAGLGLTRAGNGDLIAMIADGSLWTIPNEGSESGPIRTWTGGPLQATAAAGDPVHDIWAWIDATGQLLIARGSPRETRTFRVPPMKLFPNQMAFSPDGKMLAITGKSQSDPLLLVDPETGTTLEQIPVPWAHAAGGLAWLDSDTLVCGDFGLCFTYQRSTDGSWRLTRKVPGSFASMRPIDSESSIAFDLSGVVTRRSFQDGSVLQAFKGLSDMGVHAAFSPDGSLLAAVGTDRRLHIFDAATRDQILSLRGHPAGRVVTRVEFTGDGNRVVTLDNMGGCIVWDTRSPRDAAKPPLRQ